MAPATIKRISRDKKLKGGLTIMLEELEARLKVLEDVDAIKKLKATFAHLIDAGNWDALVNLFTDDGALISVSERHKGKAELTKYFSSLPYSFMMHMYHVPVIEVKGDKATGEWYFEVPVTHAEKNKALWIAGKYEDEYVKVNGVWKIKTLGVTIYYITPYEDGWVKTKMFE